MSSLLRRLRTTPFRDMVRGRVTGRFDVDALLWRAALPPTIADLVRETVKRTRLWRFEKLDVADELIGHFADGLDAGRSAETLIESFGQTTRAARLIRRAVLPAIPMDRFDGQPIRYAIEDGRPVLSSVGADGEGRMILWPMPTIQRHSSR